MTLPLLASRLAEKWALYLEFLRASLEREPEGPQAWRWEIKARVLTYLLARYGNDPTIGVVPTRGFPDSAATPPLQRAFVPPRPREVFTERLQRIAQANDLPPEEQSRLAEHLDRPSPFALTTSGGVSKSLIIIWLLLGFATGVFVGTNSHPPGYPVCFEWVSASSVWAVGLGWLWLLRPRKVRRSSDGERSSV